jgi:hypothetical protein
VFAGPYHAIEMYLFRFDRVCCCLSGVESASALRFSPCPLLCGGEASEPVPAPVTLDTMAYN